MKTTPWRKPVAECGGITDLIKREIKFRFPSGMERYRADIRIHAYREVGTSLEASYEVEVDGPFGKFFKWETIVI
ncbi:hypothetical protein CR3_gp176 [Cronobacter phage CR3]|uniref:Uncharacterized protein n=2 Tax=Certrevirus TaxID=1914850 RepID=I1TRL8_9CAUD|nr:hypothetical protein CR3_gp176 [Cronobacter phage CR3]YP_009188882.1 hypothetical protein ADU18_0016 [Cronobacter phage PBES 02]AFH21341.1 hypothetical protein CR3_176 [Cronobacter phage CR3]AKY03921.1 hypothetical protein ADU18_0016 [Cronobacter phage PBES 02]